jgi:hypothetical protein
MIRDDRRGSWIDTRRELAQLAWAVTLIDLVAVGIGALASRPMGPAAFKLGLLLAGFVTLCFALLVAGNLAVERLHHWWTTRRPR